MIRILVFFISFLLIFSSCTQRPKQENKITPYADLTDMKQPAISQDSVTSNDPVFFGDTLFPGHRHLMAVIMRQYNQYRCPGIQYKKQALIAGFQGYKVMGDVNNDQKPDTVFVLPPLNVCEQEEGQSYYFTDTTLPRLVSGSFCCRPSNFFRTADIDEDGICEVGIFYSTCTSRYKSIRIFRLRNRAWQLIATSGFDILTQDPEKVKFEDLVRKKGKNALQIRTFMEGKDNWETVQLK